MNLVSIDDNTYKNIPLTLELVSTFTSVVIFLFVNLVLTSAKNNSPFLVPVEVIACKKPSQAFKLERNHIRHNQSG